MSEEIKNIEDINITEVINSGEEVGEKRIKNRWLGLTEEEKSQIMQERTFNTSLFNIDGSPSAGKRGRKPTVMSRTEWEMFYLNKSIKELVTELVEIKMDGLITLRREEYEELLKYKREVATMKQKFESFKNTFLNSTLFDEDTPTE